MKQLFAAASLVALMAASPVLAAEAMRDKTFVTEAQQDHIAQVELSRIAQSQAQNQDVKAYAEGMVNDHGKAMEQLAGIARKHNIEVPTKTDATHQKKADTIKAMKGAEFDQAYMSDMVKDHQKGILTYQEAQKSVKEADLKAYIDQTLPVLQQHLKAAQKLHQPQAAATGEKSQKKEQTR